MGHNIKIQILPGVSHFFEVRQSERSVDELLNTSGSLTNKSYNNIRLNHPPVFIIKDGGGEQLLNMNSLKFQLGFRKPGSQKVVLPESLITYVIDPEKHDKDMVYLYQFLFSRVELLHYQKKEGSKVAWKTVMQQIEEDEYLKQVIENNFFNGEKLSSRHYKILLVPARLSDSAIDHALPVIRNEKKVEDGKDNKYESVKKKGSSNSTVKEKEVKKVNGEALGKNEVDATIKNDNDNSKVKAEKHQTAQLFDHDPEAE